MPIGVLSLYFHLPGCSSLKDKRSRIKPLLARLHREFNVSAAEMDHLDAWRESTIAVGLVSNDPTHIQQVLQRIPHWMEVTFPDFNLVDEKFEIL